MTTFYDAAFAIRGIANRTDPAGTAVTDLSAEEDRLSESLLTAGVVAPDDAFLVRPVAGAMQVTVGSGSARVDEAVVAGTQAGQTPYRVRLNDVDVTVDVDPADASQERIDSIWLYVADASYDGGTLSLPRIAYRPGTPGGAAPGPEAGWTAYLRLADVTVPAAATNVDTGVADRRVFAQVAVPPEDHAGRHASDGDDAVSPSSIGAATSAALTSHEGKGGNNAVHGADWEATPGTIVRRTTAGRSQFSTPNAAADAATKGYADAHANLTGGNSVHGADWQASASTLVRRTTSSRAQFADPSAAADAATKGYVDGQSFAVGLGSTTAPLADFPIGLTIGNPSGTQVLLTFKRTSAVGMQIWIAATVFARRALDASTWEDWKTLG